jgi:hypothetical protein
MSTQWEDVIGKFDSLKAAKVVNTTVECLYKTILKRFDQLGSDALDVDPDWVNPFANCLSLAEETELAAHKGKDKPKFTYEAEVTETEEVEKDGKKTKKSTGKKKMAIKNKGKICTATADGRTTLNFCLLKFVKEIKDLYVANNNKFPEETTLLSELATFTSNPTEVGVFNVSPFILGLTDNIDVNKVVDAVYGDLDGLILAKLSEMFKSTTGTPTAQITKLVSRWVQFVKLIALQAAAFMWHKKARIDGELLKLLLRQLSVFGNREFVLDEMFFKVLDEYNAEAARIAEEVSKVRKEKAAATKAAKEAGVDPSADPENPEQDEFITGLDDAQDDISSALASESNEWTDEVNPDE